MWVAPLLFGFGALQVGGGCPFGFPLKPKIAKLGGGGGGVRGGGTIKTRQTRVHVNHGS